MAKAVGYIRYVLIFITVGFLSVLLFSFYTVPDEIESLQGENSGVNDIYTLTYEKADDGGMRSLAEGQYKVKISFLNMPIKDSVLNVRSRQYVALSGDIIGLRLFTEGVMIVDVDTVETLGGTRSPGAEAGLEAGDIICRIDSEENLTVNRVNELIKYGSGDVMEIEYIRNSQHYTTTLLPAYSTDNCYKGGLWIRDSAAGIGTVSFYDVKTGVFAALGHAVCDIDTGEVLPLLNGDVVSAQIVGCNKGVIGKAGELCGMFNSESTGILLQNSETGVYGIFDQWDENAELYPVATFSEIETGKAQIISTVNSSGREYYDIEVLKISENNEENKHMVIEITDDDLINVTGGIVQGMSGSPIIQNGRLIGVVTHVLVNNPKKGYAIFAETMIESARE